MNLNQTLDYKAGGKLLGNKGKLLRHQFIQVAKVVAVMLLTFCLQDHQANYDYNLESVWAKYLFNQSGSLNL